LQRRVSHFVFDIERGAFHFGEAQAAAHQVGVAVGFQKRRSLFHARLDLDPVGCAVVEDLGKAGVNRVGLEHGHDVCRLERVGQLFDFLAGGMTELDP